jgi:carbamoyl-phosphate synthase large subunit
MRFLVSGAGGDIGQSIANILTSHYEDAIVFGSDIHDEFLANGLYEEIKLLPPVSSPAYLDSLRECIVRERINVFIPTSEAELRWLVARDLVLDSLPSHCLMASSKAMEIGFDKFLTSKHLAKNGMPVPWACIVSDSDLGAPEIPCILKSRFGAGNSSVYYVDSLEKSLYFQKLFPDYIWQQFLPMSNGEFTCGVYRCLDGATRVLALKRRLSSGVTSFAEVVNEPSIENLCISIAESLDLFGSINIQLRLVEGLGPMVFEINPRFSSTVGMRHAIGFSDLIWSVEEQYLEKNASPCPSSWPNVRLGRRYDELIETR